MKRNLIIWVVLIINVAVNNYNAVSELDYTNYGGEEAFRKALVNAKTENEVYEQLVEKEYHLKLESWDFLLSQKDGESFTENIG